MPTEPMAAAEFALAALEAANAENGRLKESLAIATAAIAGKIQDKYPNETFAAHQMNVRWGRTVQEAEARAETAERDAAALRETLERIERWELPEVEQFWPSGDRLSYEAAYGSNGARTYIREIAGAALRNIAAEPQRKGEGS